MIRKAEIKEAENHSPPSLLRVQMLSLLEVLRCYESGRIRVGTEEKRRSSKKATSALGLQTKGPLPSASASALLFGVKLGVRIGESKEALELFD